MNSVVMPNDKCLKCGKMLDRAAGVSGKPSPSTNDLTICFYCGHVMAFAADLSLRELTEAEIVEAAGNMELQFVLAQIVGDNDGCV